MNKLRPSPKLRQIIARLPASEFAAYKARGNLLIRTPIADVLGGFLIEGSQFNAPKRYVWRFVLPLWVHQEMIFLTHGDRLFRTLPDGTTDEALDVSGDPSEIDATIELMMEDGLPWIESHISSEVIYNWDFKSGGGRAYRYEIQVMGATFLGRQDLAHEHCKRALSDIRVAQDESEWTMQRLARIREFCGLLSVKQNQKAVLKVQENIVTNWERFNLHAFD